MFSFTYSFGLAFVFSLLITSGAGHLFKFPDFCVLLRDHNVVAHAWVPVVAFIVMVSELVGGGLALSALARNSIEPADLLLFTASACAGVIFCCYLLLLLRRPSRSTSCGCSPVSGPLTPVSLVPAALLSIVSVAGLLATLFGLNGLLTAADSLPATAMFLPILWGVTVAVTAVLLPGTVPVTDIRVR